MKKLKAGILGLGIRGYMYLENVILDMKELEVVAISDLIEERNERALSLCEKYGIKPNTYNSSIELMDNEDLDCVFIFTPWISHIDLSIYAMKKKIAVAMEVGGAYDIHEIWQLVDTYEETKTPYMFLENCLYGRLELMTLNMVRKGVLGEIVYCQGGYRHDLRDEVSEGYYNNHYRLDNYRKRNGENYPSHELLPLAKILNINKGNRFISLSSQASKACGLKEYINNNDSIKVDDARGLNFNQGDIVKTTIKCSNGELVSITLDTTLPRYYTREFMVQVTKGLVNEENRSVFLEKDTDISDHFQWEKHFNNLDRYYEEYEHPIWKKYLKENIKKGHGGIDYLVVKAFVDALINNEPMPIDVYDAASILAVTSLSEESIALSGLPVYFPDFTRGKWMYDEKSFLDRNKLL